MRKRYRWYFERKYFHGWYHPLAKIKWRFFYYSLYEISVFNFGGRDLITYRYVKSSRSIFSFRHWLKVEGVIKNLVHEKREKERHMNSWPKELRESFERMFK